jgi:cyclohexanecarboxyl-CoA dehydrogenase
MLDFSFTPTQEEFRKQLRDFSLRELLPRYQEGDEQRRYPSEQIMHVIRFIDEFWKGHEKDRDLITVGITAEEVARGDFNCVLQSLGAPYYGQFFADLSPAQQERWLPGIRSGERPVGLCITEPSAGSDMGRLEAFAELCDDSYVINGVKNSVSYLNADVFYVFVRTDRESRGWEGISGFLVPRNTPGLSFEAVDDLGCRAVPRGILRFDDVKVPLEDMVGEPGTAFIRISKFFDVNRAVIGLKCVGAAQQTVDETIAYGHKRIVFGAPVVSHQSVNFELAEAETHLELARWQCYRVLWLRQQGLPCQREGAMAKWWAPKVAADVIHKCLLFHGHYGYSRALPVQQRLRDVIGWQIGDGSEEVMKLLIARDLLTRSRE